MKMSTKKNSYISAELDFAEAQLSTWKAYIEANPLDKLEDRWGKKEMPRGGYTMVVVADVEKQITSIRNTMKEYLQLLEIVDKLREKEEAKKLSVRGDQELTPFEQGDM